ncbi:hypothetical protein AB6A40_010045 [Gnathostoma spinigerum]|uniref:IBB domain-containing protein n=1 Tax=Gnathostoma spinigerum TaxID=75299 RepID=A0ABD6F0D0_9BILA
MSQEVCGTVQTVEETRLQKLYKNSAKHEDMRRRRTECSVELRKQKKDEALMKRRNIAPLDDVTDSEISGTEESILAAGEVKCTVGNITPSDICRILSSNPSLEEIRTCFTNLRRLLARDRNPPVREVIEANLLPALKAGIEFEDRTVQLEAAWAITNIVSGSSEDTASAVEAGIIPRLVQMCFLDDFDLAEQACWALANIAGDSATLRDICIREGIIDSLEYLVSRAEKLRVQFLRTIAWAYSNLCRHKNPQASIEHTSRLVKGIEVLLSNEDAVVRQDTCWALSYLTDGEDGYIRDANQGNVMAFVLKMLNSENDAAIKPAIRVLGNFATGSDDLTQVGILFVHSSMAGHTSICAKYKHDILC